MLLPNQEVEIDIRRHNLCEYYQSKGYDVKLGQKIKVKAEDLMPTSDKKVWVTCDYCNREPYQISYRIYHNNVLNALVQKCACKDCGRIKVAEIHMIKYGVANPRQRPEVVEKARQTCLERYGVTNVMQLPEVRQKAQDTCIEKYGYVSPFQLPEMQEKIKATRLKKYGVEYMLQSDEIRGKAIETFNQKYGGNTPMCSPEVRAKGQATCLERYGYISPLSSDEILSKTSLTRFLNGTCALSIEQAKLVAWFNGIPNYPVGRYNVDILLDDNIVLEYDGGAHRIDIKYGRLTDVEFDAKETQRSQYIIDRGYRIIRFVNIHDATLEHEVCVTALAQCKLLLQDHTMVSYDFDTGNILI